MGLLIRNGLLMTMTETGETRGDLLIQNGRIEQIADQIDPADASAACILDADGLVIMPGMIDMSVHDDTFPPEYLAREAASAGITTMIIRDSTGRTVIVAGEDVQPFPAGSCMISVFSAEDFQRITAAAESMNDHLILTGLTQCQSCAEAIAASGCSVVLNAAHHGECSWEFAAALDSLGVHVAVGSRFPHSRMKLLAICAGLCHRAGMPHDHALRTVTSTPADILRLADRGRIQVGCRADLAIFDGDPMLLASSHVMTLLGGRIVCNDKCS